MKRAQFEGIIRHVVTAGGAYAALNGFGTEAVWVQIAGGLAGVGGLLWSIFAPEKKA